MRAADETHPDGRGNPEIVVCADAAAVAEKAARRVRQLAAAALRDRDRWRLCLAGGSTPRLLYRRLAEPAESPGTTAHVDAHADVIDWSRTEIFFGDERAVPPDHADSNYAMVSSTLLSSAEIPPANVHRMKGEASDLDAAAREYETAMIGAAGPRFALDLALLGMGADGHTASLFPWTTALTERKRLCVAVDVPKLGARRLTLTYPVFEQARRVFFLVAGRDKAATLRAVIEGPALYRDFPAQPIMRRLAPVTIFCDRDAASELSSEEP
ncbi:MAG TPA: 6-phosphogluconolactonase [Polyangia bacterium]|jgi:6-phosphogluconolactonase|nr:6-phosphogluconolactonase [Polyangia bacterium]